MLVSRLAQSLVLGMEGTCPTETMAGFYHTTWRYITEEITLHAYENVKTLFNQSSGYDIYRHHVVLCIVVEMTSIDVIPTYLLTELSPS
jgi:hypothetical protein